MTLRFGRLNLLSLAKLFSMLFVLILISLTRDQRRKNHGNVATIFCRCPFGERFADGDVSGQS